MEAEKLEQKLNEIAAALRFQIGTKGVRWLEDVSLKAENFAVSYDYMYVMTRALNYMVPDSMLELGMGQTSKILSAYCASSIGVLDIVEQGKDWINFMRQEMDLRGRIRIHHVPMIKKEDPEHGTPLNCYEDISEIVNGKRFEFISIDGPFGSPRNSRTDLLPYIPKCLAPSWCIMLDDYGRQGEHDMIEKLKKTLDGSGIEHRGKEYGVGSEKQFYLICSEDNKYLTTLL